MHMAHILAKQEVPFGIRPRTWSENVKYAWYFVHFCQALNSGIVTFSFWKKDGSIREAKGTTHPLLIPLDKKPKGNQIINHKFETINYYDLDRNDWRSFSITNFIGFVTIYELKEKRNKRENHAGGNNIPKK